MGNCVKSPLHATSASVSKASTTRRDDDNQPYKFIRPEFETEKRPLRPSNEFGDFTIGMVEDVHWTQLLTVFRARRAVSALQRMKYDNRLASDGVAGSIQVISTLRYTYYGEELHGKKCGFGTFVYSIGSVYRGFWADGLPSDFGVLVHPSGQTYTGYWLDGLAHGTGQYSDPIAGVWYQGEWYKNMKQGHGLQVWDDGSLYEGEFWMGVKHGKGKLRFVSGDEYDGEFQKDAMHGSGVYRWIDGRVYDGEWANGTIHGYGKYTWPATATKPGPRIYEGYYLQGKRDGRGKFVWENGSYYDGLWKNGKQCSGGDGY